METVGSTAQVNVVVQWASKARGTALRLKVQRDNDTENVTSPVLADLGRVDMGDYKKLTEFVKWGMEKFPAKHYLVDVWNHGNGWEKKSASIAPQSLFSRCKLRRFEP